VLFFSYRSKITGTEELNKKKAAQAEKKENKKNQEYRLIPSAIITDIHYIF
jgi:hypothetical protein